jgi:hypothetical protein
MLKKTIDRVFGQSIEKREVVDVSATSIVFFSKDAHRPHCYAAKDCRREFPECREFGRQVRQQSRTRAIPRDILTLISKNYISGKKTSWSRTNIYYRASLLPHPKK